ncbi:MAG: TGS domain-containing protein [Bacteroidales bacterium]|nr:TGS domain-containing protein [Bacteroidales bacterium]
MFTPDSDLKKLPAGSTVLDFAYHVHSRVGEQCTGAIVNGRNVPIRYELKNGDTVKTLTSKNQTPSEDWVNYVKSNRTKVKIRRSLRQKQYSHTDAGKAILLRKLNQLKIQFEDEVVNNLLKHFKVKTSQDLMRASAARILISVTCVQFLLKRAGRINQWRRTCSLNR